MENSNNLHNSSKKMFTCIWAIPKKKEISSIIKIKQGLDKVLKGPDFPIHMTLSGDSDLNYFKLKKLLPELKKSIPRFKVSYGGYGIKNVFFQAFYIEVILDKQLRNIRSNIYEILKKKNQTFMPHMSLYYGKESNKKKKKLLDNLPFIEGSFLVDALYMVSFDSQSIEWKVLNTINLKKS